MLPYTDNFTQDFLLIEHTFHEQKDIKICSFAEQSFFYSLESENKYFFSTKKHFVGFILNEIPIRILSRDSESVYDKEYFDVNLYDDARHA